MAIKDSSRRDFIKRNSLAGLGLTALGTFPGLDAYSSESVNAGIGSARIKSLAGLSLQQLYDRYHDELFKRFLPAMDSLCVDHQYGGFMCDVDINIVEL